MQQRSHIARVLSITLASLQRLLRTASQSGGHEFLHVTRELKDALLSPAIALYSATVTTQRCVGTSLDYGLVLAEQTPTERQRKNKPP